MSSLSRFFTLLKAYFGDSLSRLLSLVYRGKMNESVDSSSSIDLTTDTESAAFKPDEVSSSGAISQLLDALESSPDTSEFTGQDLLRAAVYYDLDALPSLPSIFSLPEPRPPLDMSPSSPRKQDFGAPSNLYYDRRTLGDVTNFRDFDQAKGAKLNTQVKPRKALKAKQSKSRRRRPAMTTLKVLPVEDSSATVVVKLTSPTVAVIDPAPGSEEWNTPNKASVLAQARNWSNQIQASRHHSLLVPPLLIDLPVLERSHRHSAPPVLVIADKLNLHDRLSALFKEAKDTIAALDEETNAKGTKGEGSKAGFCKQNARKFSAIALEEGRGEIFVIGVDSDEEEVGTTAPRTSRQDYTTDMLPTDSPESSNLVSSISASASMEAFASISTRSISDLFNTLDAVMTGPTWLGVLSRSDDITRRTNDSMV